MEPPRRQSVSELNLEEILLAMAEHDEQSRSQSTKPLPMMNGSGMSSMGSKPLPTPRPKPKGGLVVGGRPNSLPPQPTTPTSAPYYVEPQSGNGVQQGYYDPYNGQSDPNYTGYYQPEEMVYQNPRFDSINQRHSMYEQGQPSYDYYKQQHYDPALFSNPYPEQSIGYNPYQYQDPYAIYQPYMHPYPTNEPQPIYSDYGDGYYDFEGRAVQQDQYYQSDPYNESYQPYEYMEDPSNYYSPPVQYEPNSQYQESPNQYYESTTSSRCSTPRRPLPRLPPKKSNSVKPASKLGSIPPSMSHDLTFGTPSIESSYHLGLEHHVMGSDRQDKLFLEQLDSPAAEPPIQADHDTSKPNEDMDNLAELLDTITTKINHQKPALSEPIKVTQPNLTLPPQSPLPPPRLSKEEASKRLSESFQRFPGSSVLHHLGLDSKLNSPAIGNMKGLGSAKPSTPSMVARSATRNNMNGKSVKRNESRRIQPSKPQNCIQLAGYSRPVIDLDADGFDFDESDFETIDKLVKTLNIPDDCELELLVRDHLTSNYNYEWQKLRAMFVWIVNNITYDLDQQVRSSDTPVQDVLDADDLDDDSDDEIKGDEEVNSQDSSPELQPQKVYSESAKAVLIRRSACHHGFANLFKAMVDVAGLECEVIEGFLKDPFNSSDLGKFPQSNHSWVSVKIQGYYRLIDCGLATSSHIYNVHRKQDLFYFLTNPSKLIFTHFPLNKRFQYLRPPIDFSVFAQLPFATSYYFDFGIQLIDLPDGPITVNEDQTAELNLQIPEGMKCWGELEMPDPISRNVKRTTPLVQCRSKEYTRTCQVMIRIKGKSDRALLKVRCGYPQESKILPHCFTLKINHTGTKPPEEFVKILPSPTEFFLVEPINFDLLYNIQYRFHVLPGQFDAKHFKLALRSPTMKAHKFVYYPGDQGYIANVTLRERGQWAISYMVTDKAERPSKRDPWINVACYRCI